jgi:hypothetical protein
MGCVGWFNRLLQKTASYRIPVIGRVFLGVIVCHFIFVFVYRLWAYFATVSDHLNNQVCRPFCEISRFRSVAFGGGAQHEQRSKRAARCQTVNGSTAGSHVIRTVYPLLSLLLTRVSSVFF